MNLAILAATVLSPTLASDCEYGPFRIRSAPVDATQIAGDTEWRSLNVVDQEVDLYTAFTGFSVADDGFANGDAGTTVELRFFPGTLVNTPGDDLVMLDGRFSDNDYRFSTEYDGFSATITKNHGDFVDTGVAHVYYFFYGGPYQARVMAATFDLSTLGVPNGASVERVRFIAKSDEIDPLGMGVLCKEDCDFQSYCNVNPNSTGLSARISAVGCNNVLAKNMTLYAAPVPNEFFVFFFGPNQTEAPFGNGYLCVAGGLTRILPPESAHNFQAIRVLDFDALNLSSGTKRFQCWFRDPMGGGSLFNTSDALSILFTL